MFLFKAVEDEEYVGERILEMGFLEYVRRVFEEEIENDENIVVFILLYNINNV